MFSVSDLRGKTEALSSRTLSRIYTAFVPPMEYTLTIGTNNTAAKTVNRADVKAAWAHMEGVAFAEGVSAMYEAWDLGLDLAAQTIADQAASLGVEVPDFDIDSALVERLEKDIARNVQAMTSEGLRGYLNEGEEGMKKAANRHAYRASLTIEAAVKHALSEAVHEAFSGMGLYKKWDTHSPIPCSHCVYLSLLPPIPWEEEWPEEIPGLPPLKVYSKPFLSPPRHPYCACTNRAVKAPGN